MTRQVLVANATGRLGKALVERLRSGAYGSFEVRVLTDTLDDDTAEALERRGATLVEAAPLDADALTAAVDDVDAVFLAVDVDDADAEKTKQTGEALVDAAERTDLSQLVYVSAASVDSETETPEFATIYAIERHVRDSTVPWTVLRPACLMQRSEEWRRGIESGTLTLPLEEDVSLHLVDAADVAALVARALGSPDTFVGEAVELAADSYTLDELATAFEEALGHDVTGVRAPMDVAREELPAERVALFEFVNDGGYAVDVDAARDRYDIEFTQLETYLDKHWATETAESSESVAD